MNALVVTEFGAPAHVADRPSPTRGPGEALVRVRCTALNPADMAIASGGFFAGHPPPPYVPGLELVGEVVESDAHKAGSLVFACLNGLGVRRDGGVAELAVASDEQLVPLPEGIDPLHAIAAGTASLAAWVPLTRRAPVVAGDVVLILGATGCVGQVAVQTAHLRGAARVIAAGRDPGRLAATRALGADATIELGDPAGFAEAITAHAPDGVSLIFDTLWGDYLAAALQTTVPHARVINLGQASSPGSTLLSSVVRGRDLDLLGYTNVNVPLDVLAERYLALLEHVRAGDVRVELKTFALADAGEAWRLQPQAGGRKLVICP